MARGTEELPVAKPGELRKFQQLVELQSQLVEVARKNEQAEKECDALWRELERNARKPRQISAGAGTLAVRLLRLRRQLLADLRARISGTRAREAVMRLSPK
jgi:hypothetical protein